MLTSSKAVRHLGQLAVLSGLLAITGAFRPIDLRGADLSLPITGSVVGSVTDAAGVPQTGATIQLLNKYRQAVAKATSDVDGRFAFSSVPADLYSLRASLASFLPVSTDNLTVKAGLSSVLQIHMATLISSVEVNYTVPTAAMTDDWKWALRSSNTTRPINRYLPVDLHAEEPSISVRTPIFSSTHASLSLSGGDGGPLDSDSSYSDFGTAFALSTQLYGQNLVQISGSFGQEGASGSPAFGVSALYARNDGTTAGHPPEVTFSATQSAGPGNPGVGTPTANPASGSLSLRTMSLSIYDVVDPLTNLHLEYGVSNQAVDYLQHTSRISPFARATIDLGQIGQLITSYSDGGRPDQLLRHSTALGSQDTDSVEDNLAASLASLQKLPQMSNHSGKLVLQRTRSYELGYNKISGTHTVGVSAFAEDVTDGRLSVAGEFSPEISSGILSDALSRTSVYNIGRYRRRGYIGSADQRLKGNIDVGLAYGRMGGFEVQQLLDQGSIGQHSLRQRESNFASASIRTVVPRVGTRIHANYGWMDSGTVIPRHIFTTQQGSAAPGLNVYVRQPMPTLFGIPGRIELTADLRNLLAQGYLPLALAGGRQMLIIQSPQSVRGGLNFIF